MQSDYVHFLLKLRHGHIECQLPYAIPAAAILVCSSDSDSSRTSFSVGAMPHTSRA